REPGKPHPVSNGVREPARQVGALRHQQGEVIEAGVPPRGTRARPLDEDQQLAPAGAQRSPASASLKELQPDGRLVVADRPLEVGDRQVHRAERRPRRDLGRGRRAGGLELLRVADARLGPGLVCGCALHLTLLRARRSDVENLRHVTSRRMRHVASRRTDAGAGLNRLAVAATTHCLIGCVIGEVAGMTIATAWGWGNAAQIGLAVVLAYLFGFGLTATPLVRAGLSAGAVVSTALAVDTLSITIMEVIDNLTVVLIPNALDAGLGDH